MVVERGEGREESLQAQRNHLPMVNKDGQQAVGATLAMKIHCRSSLLHCHSWPSTANAALSFCPPKPAQIEPELWNGVNKASRIE